MKTPAYPSYSYSNLPQLKSESSTVFKPVFQTKSRTYSPISQNGQFQTYKPSNETNVKLFTPLVPHKSYRMVQSLQPQVNVTATYHCPRDRVSESKV